MNDDLRRRLRVARERLSDLEEDLASAHHVASSGDACAATEATRLIDLIESQKQLIRDLESQL